MIPTQTLCMSSSLLLKMCATEASRRATAPLLSTPTSLSCPPRLLLLSKIEAVWSSSSPAGMTLVDRGFKPHSVLVDVSTQEKISHAHNFVRNVLTCNVLCLLLNLQSTYDCKIFTKFA